MACISITIGHSGTGNNAIIYFNATDGSRSLYGDRAFGWGGMGTPTDAEYTASVTPYILSWFGATEVDLCSYIPPFDNTLLYAGLIVVGVAVLYVVLNKKQIL